jgi:hypothetical protein
MYSTPLMGFIDDACLIFDTEEENKLEYTQTHEDFKQLVDTLISDYLLELGVAPEQFAQVSDRVTESELRGCLYCGRSREVWEGEWTEAGVGEKEERVLLRGRLTVVPLRCVSGGESPHRSGRVYYGRGGRR